MNYKLREVRIEKEMTLEEVGHAIGRSKQWMSELERGNIDLKYDTAVDLAKVYGGTPDIFLPIKSKKISRNAPKHQAS